MFSSFSDINQRLGSLTADINLGSISDINQRFSQLASQLSLDNLQNDENSISTTKSSAGVSTTTTSTAVNNLSSKEGISSAENIDKSSKFESKSTISTKSNNEITPVLMKPEENSMKMNELNEIISKQEMKIKQQNESLLSLQNQMDEITKSYQNKLIKQENENEELRLSVKSLEETKQSLETSVLTLTKTLKSSEENMKSCNQTVETIKKQIFQLENEKIKLISDMSEMEQNGIEIRLQKENSEKDLIAFKMKLESITMENKENMLKLEHDSNVKVSKLEDTISSLKKEKEHWNHRIEDMMSEIRVLQSRLSSVSTSTSDISTDVNLNASTATLEESKVTKITPSSTELYLSERAKELEEELNKSNQEKEEMNIRNKELNEKFQSLLNDYTRLKSIEEEYEKTNMEKSKIKEKLDKTVTALKTLKDTTNQLKAQITQITSEQSTEREKFHESYQLLMIEKETMLSDSKKQSEEFEKQISQKLTIISELEQERNSLRQQGMEYEHRIEDLRKTITEQNTATSNTMNDSDKVISEYQNQLHSLQAQNQSLEKQVESQLQSMEEKDNVIVDLKGKISILTDKMKDVMKKFAEVKARNQILEETEGRTSEISKILQAKDSELVSMKLKFDNLERTSEDNKQALDDLSERYGDLQRENQRLKVNIDSDSHEKELLYKDIQTYKSKCDEFYEEKNILQSQLQSMESSMEEERRKYEQNLLLLNENHEKQIQGLRDHISALEQEHSLVQIKLREEDNISKTLDDYKKRAQAALKQANANAATLSSENMELRKKLESKDEEIYHMNEAIQALKSEQSLFIHKIETLTRDYELAKEEISSLKSEISKKDIEIIHSKDTADKAISQLSENMKLLTQTKNQGHSAENPNLYTNTNPSKNTMSSRRESNTSLMVTTNTSTKTTDKVELDPVSSSSSTTTTTGVSLKQEKQSILSQISGRPMDRTSPNSDESYEEVNIQDDFVNVSFHKKSQSAETLYYINQLHKQLEELKQEATVRGLELTQTQTELIQERESKKLLSQRIDELVAFIERSRQQQSPEESVINFEYLKNCIYRFMSTSELSEKKRLSPVISTLLKLTKEERSVIDTVLREEEAAEDDLVALTNIGSIASNSIGSFFSGTTSLFGST